MLVSTAISTLRLSIERSDSSASTMSQSPLPHRAFGRSAATAPPTSQPGSRPAARRAATSIEAVVVLPCVPATAIVRLSAVSSHSSSARGRSRRLRARAAERSTLSAGTAEE
jgi:hypothetical protein